MPIYLPLSIADGLLLVGAQRYASFRTRFFRNRVPRWLHKVTPEEFDVRCEIARNDPLMVASLLGRFPKRFPGTRFEDEFIREIYAGYDVPEDVGHQVLAFGCCNVMLIWVLRGWPRMRVIHRRLHALARSGWRVRSEEFVRVVYREFIAP